MSKELVKTTAALVPAYIAESREGLENVGRDEIQFPRIEIAQDSSGATKKAHSAHIEGIESGDLYNTLTREIYSQPLRVIPIMFFYNYIKFRPQDQGGGVLRMADTAEGINPKDLLFGPNSEKPVWTTIFNFLCFLPGHGQVVVVSMKSTSATVAKQWLSLQTLFGKRPAYARAYTLASTFKENGANSYFNYLPVKSTGFVSEEDYKTCEQLYHQFAGKTIQAAEQAEDGQTAF